MRRYLFLVTVCLLVVAPSLSCTKSKGEYRPPPAETPPYAFPVIPTPVIKDFVDVYKEQEGIVILDIAHSNFFQFWETNVPVSRVVARGYQFDYLLTAEDLEAKLRLAEALVVILPQTGYTKDDAQLVKEFVAKGGKLLLIGDPTRPSEVNSLATEFDLIFEEDYLYNLVENNLNFKNIFVSEFKDGRITQGLKKITLYTAGFITSPGKGIGFGDANTLASTMERPGKFSPMALASDSRVLALADFTFMMEPFNAVFDNNQLISNIADWLTDPGRVFLITDFPYFLDEPLEIGYADSALLDKTLALRNSLATLGLSAGVSEYKEATDLTEDTVFLGLLKHASKVETFLEAAEILITTLPEEKGENEVKPAQPEATAEKEEKAAKIEIGGFGDVYQEGTGLFYLYEVEGKHALILLADSEETLGEVIGLFENGGFRDWLISSSMGVFYTSEDWKQDTLAPENKMSYSQPPFWG